MILFVDDVADDLSVPNTTVIVLEKDHGMMDVIRWIEAGRFSVANYDIVSLMIGRGDLKRGRPWFTETLEEVIKVIKHHNNTCLMLMGAVVPARTDSPMDVKEFKARNKVIQDRCLLTNERFRMEYTRPEKLLYQKEVLCKKFLEQMNASTRWD